MFAEEEAHLLVAEAATSLELAILVDRRVAGLPLEHVLGWAEFGGMRVLVEPEVFVPRRRTELLASEAVALARAVAPRHGRPPVVVELCCGSGAVSAVLLAELDPIELYAADLDPIAVRCARRNLGERARVLWSDLYAELPAPLRRRVDVLVANAPYVPTAELALMPPEARLHEPTRALNGGADGLDVLREVISGAPPWLAADGALLVETGAAQGAAVAAVMASAGLRPRTVRSPEPSATVVIGSS